MRGTENHPAKGGRIRWIKRDFLLRPFVPENLSGDRAVADDAWTEICAGCRAHLGDELYDRFYAGQKERLQSGFIASLLAGAKDGASFTVIDTADGGAAAMGSFFRAV